MPSPSVLMICQFGQPVRGLSPYGDALLESLNSVSGIRIYPVDYRAPYPSLLHPGSEKIASGPGELQWSNPASWYRLAKSKADIIHLQHWLAPMACYLAPMISMAKFRGKKVIITVHNPTAHEMLQWPRLFEKWLLKQGDALITHDARGAAALQKLIGKESPRIHIIPHGIQIATSPPAPQDDDYKLCRLDPNRRYVCIFGNLRGYKGINILLAAWAKVATRLPDVDLVIAGRLWTGQSGHLARLASRSLGTNRDADYLRNALADPALARRIHLQEGFVSDTAIDALLRISEFAVFPYIRFSSQSGAACRAAGMGCPVLVSDVGGLPDLAIDTEWVIAPGNIDSLAAALYRLLNNPAELSAARQRQLESISLFEWAKIAESHITLYRELLSG